MKIPLTLVAIIALVLAAGYWFAPPPDPALLKPRTDLPWQVNAKSDGSSQVFDIHLGRDTLQQAIDKFGPVEDYAVFVHEEQSADLEAYFGQVMFGPLKAKIVVQLEASDAEKATLVANAGQREASPSGDWKYRLATPDRSLQNQRLITAITYQPGTRGLDQAFFLERFGQPEAVLQENEHAVSWFYPQLGLSILIDSKGREVLEYLAPRDFVMPPGVSAFQDPSLSSPSD